ncbi:MAG TPA: glycosyltransferase [Rhodothermales bacterium]
MRILFVSYYFPPSGGPGVQRSLKFTRYLPDFGCEPVVLTVRPEDAAYPALDRSLLDEVPASLEVHRTKAWDPYGAYAALVGRQKDETVGVGFLGESNPNWKQRAGRWLRANVFLPDARVGWVPYAIRTAERLISERRFDAVWTTGPPHSAHLIGRRLASRHRLRWVADFRDPWTGIDYAEMLPTTALARRFDHSLERKVLTEASAVVVVSPSMASALSEQVERAYTVIPNGFDPADFQSNVPVGADVFRIAHVGSLNVARNPETLWRALARLRDAGEIPALRVQLVGRVDPAVAESARSHGLESILEHVDYLEHREAVSRMQRSALLLLVINRVEGADGILTGKLFEYVGSGRPVLGLGPANGDAARILRDTGGGEMIGFDSVDEVSELVGRHYRAWRAGTPVGGAAPEKAERYSRRAQAEELAAVFESVGSARTEEGPVS